MRNTILPTAVLLLTLALSAHAKPATRVTGEEINEFVDRLVEQVKIYIIEHGMEPFAVPDQVSDFSYKDFLGIVWHGEASLRNGHLQGLNTLHRVNDVDLAYEEQVITVDAQIGFTRLQFDSNFEASIMDIGPKGQALILANGVHLGFTFRLDLASLSATLLSFEIAEVGDIDLTIHGLGSVFDFLVEVLGNVVVDLFKGPILGALEDAIFQLIKNALENISLDKAGELVVAPIMLA